MRINLCSIRSLIVVAISLGLLRCLIDISGGSLFYRSQRAHKANILHKIMEKPLMSGVSNGQIGSQKLYSEHETESRKDKCFMENSKVLRHLNNITTDLSTWSYAKRIICPNVCVINYHFKKIQPLIHIKCGTAKAEYRGKIQTISYDSDCIDRYIKYCCSDNMPVPNIVHYVWYGRKSYIDFYGFLSFISVLRFVRPCLILIHGNLIPEGPYWKFIISIYPNIVHIKRLIESNKIFGKKAKHVNHFSDVIRIEALLKYGGIYLDMDMVLVKDIDSLRRYPCTMSYLRPHLHLGSSYIMAERNSTFMQKWYDGYKYHYNNESYAYSAMHYPYMLATNFTDLIHVEDETISKPLELHRDRLFMYGLVYDWSKLYGIHLWSRMNNEIVDEMSIRDMNSTFGAIARHIVFGNKELCTY